MPANSGRSRRPFPCTDFPQTNKNALSKGEGVAAGTNELLADQAFREAPRNRRTSPSTLSAPEPFSSSGSNATR